MSFFDDISNALGTSGNGGGLLGAVESLGQDVVNAFTSLGNFVDNNIPGGWASIAGGVLAVAGFPDLADLADVSDLTDADVANVMTSSDDVSKLTDAIQQLQPMVDNGTITSDQLASIASSGTDYSPSEISSLINDSGFSGDDLSTLASNGYSPTEITSLTSQGFAPSDLSTLASNGFTPSSISDLSSGFGMSPDELTNLANSGYSSNDVTSMIDKGFSPNDITSLANSGITGSDVTSLTSQGFSSVDLMAASSNGLTVNDMSSLLDSGLQPNQIAGLSNNFDATQLTNLTNNGYTANDIQSLTDNGFTPDQISNLSDQGFSPESLQNLVNADYNATDISNAVANGANSNELSYLAANNQTAALENIIGPTDSAQAATAAANRAAEQAAAQAAQQQATEAALNAEFPGATYAPPNISAEEAQWATNNAATAAQQQATIQSLGLPEGTVQSNVFGTEAYLDQASGTVYNLDGSVNADLTNQVAQETAALQPVAPTSTPGLTVTNTSTLPNGGTLTTYSDGSSYYSLPIDGQTYIENAQTGQFVTSLPDTTPVEAAPVTPTEPTTPVEPTTPTSTSPVSPVSPGPGTVNLTSTGVSDSAPGTIYTDPATGQQEIVLDSGKTVNYADYQAAQATGNPVSVDGNMQTGVTVQLQTTPEPVTTPVTPTTVTPPNEPIPEPPASATTDYTIGNQTYYVDPNTSIAYDSNGTVDVNASQIYQSANPSSTAIDPTVLAATGAAVVAGGAIAATAGGGGGAAAATTPTTTTPVAPTTTTTPTPVQPTATTYQPYGQVGGQTAYKGSDGNLYTQNSNGTYTKSTIVQNADGTYTLDPTTGTSTGTTTVVAGTAAATAAVGAAAAGTAGTTGATSGTTTGTTGTTGGTTTGTTGTTGTTNGTTTGTTGGTGAGTTGTSTGTGLTPGSTGGSTGIQPPPPATTPTPGADQVLNQPTYTDPNGTPVDTSGWSNAQIAAAIAAGYLLLSGALTPKPNMSGYQNQWFPIPTFNGAGLVNPGVNPGYIEPAPMYNNNGQAGIDQYYWGQHGYAQNMSDLANYNTGAVNAPSTPYGNPNAVNLGQLYPLQYPNPQSTAGAYGSLAAAPNQAPTPNMSYDIYHNNVQMNTAAPAIPGFSQIYGPNTQAQMASGVGQGAQYGQTLNYVNTPAQLATTGTNQTTTGAPGANTPAAQIGAISPSALAAQLQATASSYGG